MDPLTGRSGVYHGIISDVSIAPALHATILRNGSEHFAYPGISHTGSSPAEHDAIIIASHASTLRYPGYSALYYNNGHSDWIAVKEGQRNIDMLKVDNPFGLDPTLERWGDYSGIQRQYAEEGEVWTASSWGKPGSVNDTWVGHLRRPEKASSNKDIDLAGSLEAFPNPAHSIVTMEIEVPAKGKLLDVIVHDMQGKPIRNVYSRRLVQDGPVRFYFHTKELAPGTYILQAMLDGKVWANKQIVVQ
jgi:hypothetical protein